MESISKSLALLIGAMILVITTSLTTYFIVSANSQTSDGSVKQNREEINQKLKFTNKGMVDLSQTFHIPEKSLTLSKGLVGGQCFVLSNDHTPTVNRTLSVLNEEMTSDQLEAVGGTQASDFCSGLTIVPVQHFHKNYRNRRQEVKPPAAPAGHDPNSGPVTNECAQRVIVQCANDTSVYKCVSGPKEAYRAKITCKSANQFTFDLTTRCKEFQNTKSDRLANCLEKIILNQQGGAAAAQPVINKK